MAVGLTLQASFTSGELSPSLSARVELAKYQSGCLTMRNWKVQPHGGAVKRPGFLLLNELPGDAALVEFVFNQDQSYCLAFGEGWLMVFTADGAVLGEDGRPYTIETPYTLAQAKTLSRVQSADVLFIACEGVAPQRLQRLGHSDWRFEAVSFAPPLAPPQSVNATLAVGTGQNNPTATPYSYYVTALDAEGRESELSPPANIEGPAFNNWVAGSAITITWSAAPGAVEYRLYKASFGGRPGFITVLEGLSYKDHNVEAALSEGAPKYVDPFPDGDFPRLVYFYEQRLGFASTPKRPQTLWLSKSGDYANFAQYTPNTKDSPWEGTIAGSDMARFAWIETLRSLVVGTMMEEQEISSSQGAFSAETAQVKRQSRVGSDLIPAIVIRNTILHVARSGSEVLSLKYDFGADSYGGTDNSILSSHLLAQDHILNWTYQQFPDSIIWSARSDGALLGLTYHEDHQVIAWHRHDTDGQFRWVCSVPHKRRDVLFAVVRRRVGEADRYFMERLADEYVGGDFSLASFLDCALIYDRPGEEVLTLRGLDHLEGKTVGILSRGAVESPRRVMGGAITLDRPSDRVIVGLLYEPELETMPVEVMSDSGTSVGRKKYINEINVRVLNTVGLEVGLRPDNMETVKWRTTEPYGTPPRPFSGDKRAVVGEMARNVATITLRSLEPVPATVLAIMAGIEVK